jgi:4-diphosphocytidyl-2-C-methyl-D-erythritol kinase
MRLLAPAKINLHLRVAAPDCGSRAAAPGGFHPLLTWMVTVGLFDTLTMQAAAAGATEPPPSGSEGAGAAIVLSSDAPDLPTDANNLVVRVGQAWADTFGNPHPGRVGEGSIGGTEKVSAFLNKRIPSGAGLGGGSSDAAAALRGLNALWNGNWNNSRLAEFSANFGSDIPFFFHGPSSICTGRGEIVRPMAPPAVAWVTLLLPGIHVPTPQVYRRFDVMNLGRDESAMQPPDWQAWARLTADALLPRLINDLEAPAFALAPELAGLRERIEREIGRTVRMSGSGSSLFTLFDERGAAETCAERVSRQFKIRAGAYPIAPALQDDVSG